MAVCAHYDTACLCPGALDNGVGVAALLSVAQRLHRASPQATIYFVASGCKESGGMDMTGRGMLNFFGRMRNCLEHCVCLIDIDNIGHKIGTPICYVAGPKAFRESVASVPATLPRLLKERWTFEGGDNGAAHQFGIPYVWFHDRSLKTYDHRLTDTIRHVDFQKAASFVDDIETMTGFLAHSSPFVSSVRSGSLTVRPARFDDIKSICDITELAFEPVSLSRMRQDFFGENLGGKKWNAYKNRELEGFCRPRIYQVVVADWAGQVVGYATWLFDSESGVAEIGNNAVHPKFQGKGIGMALQNEIERRMRKDGFTRFAVTTLGNDIPAQKLYEKLGYTRFAESIHYLRHR
jgi:ribosomal protein S18 acetylase RimI-like enzyme